MKSTLLNISSNMEENIQFLKNKFINCSDIIYRNMNISNTHICIVYINGLIDKNLLMEQVLEKLLSCKEILNYKENVVEQIANQIPITEIEILDNLNTATYKIINGNILIFVEKNNKAISISLNKSLDTDEPTLEPAILGPKESFTKSLQNNKALIRKYLNNEDCKIIDIILGKTFQKQSSIIYLESIANKNIVNETLRRINTIDLDIIIDISNLAELIEENHYSPFPTILLTERVDKVSASLMEGQIVLLVDNSPYALILPTVFMAFFHSSEDYYNRVYLASFLRTLRLIAYFISIFLPGFYTATTLFNQELIPTKLLISIATQTSHTPFSSTAELVLMLFAFELLRELGVRLPKGIGSTVSLVGALIIGETVVRAGLVSTSVVIITAFTAISSMILPNVQLYESIITGRVLTLFLGSTLGFWGIIISFLFMLSHLCSIKSFGIPYVYSITGKDYKEINDIITRAPLWENNNKKLFKRKNKFK